jgi:ribosomal protein RSM22 (predicted rRNA methylase)
MARPLNELIGQFDAIRFDDLKSQISNRLIEILRSEALSTSVSMQVTDAIDRLRPQTLGSVMQQLDQTQPLARKIFCRRVCWVCFRVTTRRALSTRS